MRNAIVEMEKCIDLPDQRRVSHRCHRRPSFSSAPAGGQFPFRRIFCFHWHARGWAAIAAAHLSWSVRSPRCLFIVIFGGDGDEGEKEDKINYCLKACYSLFFHSFTLDCQATTTIEFLQIQ